jgi:hypothetical protein
MKIAGVALIVVGGLILGLTGAAADPNAWTGPSLPVLGAIVAVAGLILVASGGRRKLT